MQKTQTFFENKWHTGNIKIFGVEEKSSWLGMSTFDGARMFDNVTPDLDLHCQRSIRSAESLGMDPNIKWEEIVDIIHDGIKKFKKGSQLYIRPEFWDRNLLRSEGISAGFAVTIFEYPLLRPTFTANLSKFVRPAPNQAPTDAKASCLYPNSLLAAAQAQKDGFDNCVTLDPYGNVAEFTMSNIFVVVHGRIYTPKPNGTFLNGLTRQRVINLLRKEGHEVIEMSISKHVLTQAEEIFSTGNAQKIQSVIQYQDKILGEGPIAARAWELYEEFSHI